MEPLIIGHDFVYDEKRICKKMVLVVKTIGFGWYATGAVTCGAHTMFFPYCMMLTAMFASCCNSARYEWAFYKKYGTRFYSLEEFNAWKNQQLPQLHYVIDTAEIIIKLYFFIASWPLKLTIFDGTRNNAFSMCELSMTVLKIHAVVILIVYSCAILLFMCMWCSFFNNTEWVPNQSPSPSLSPSLSPSPSPSPRQVSPMYAIYTNEHAINASTIECCICLNTTKADPWVSTPCAHVFHRDCLSAWSQINATCPICRTDLA